MTAPQKTLAGVRLVKIRYGDDLRRIALRELGSADQWRDLITINGLVHPYITTDPDLAGPKVLLVGGQIKVPAPSSYATAADDPDRVYGVDLDLTDGRLSNAGADLATIGGAANLKQAYKNRIDTHPGDLQFHDDYGCRVHELKGEKNAPIAATLGGDYVSSALQDDPRTQSVPSATVQVVADALAINATVEPVSGSSVDIQTAG